MTGDYYYQPYSPYTSGGDCPHCGRCRECGRGGSYTYPWRYTTMGSGITNGIGGQQTSTASATSGGLGNVRFTG